MYIFWREIVCLFKPAYSAVAAKALFWRLAMAIFFIVPGLPAVIIFLIYSFLENLIEFGITDVFIAPYRWALNKHKMTYKEANRIFKSLRDY